jgi:hypothetical protein
MASMSGETNLTTLLRQMLPELSCENYVFCNLNSALADVLKYSPIATFQEKEGMTIVITEEVALAHQFPIHGLFKCITLTIHSSLEAVGLTAAVATKLAEKGISANVIAAYYHDHIFVPANKASVAIAALHEFSITS